MITATGNLAQKQEWNRMELGSDPDMKQEGALQFSNLLDPASATADMTVSEEEAELELHKDYKYNDDDDDYSLQTVAIKAPVTVERKINTDLDHDIPKPYAARALVAVDTDKPEGSQSQEHRQKYAGMSVLQQHISFFDRNGDGIIYPWETYQGFRAIGFGRFISVLAAFFINLTLTYPTSPCWIPSPLLPIYVANIHRGKHGSDSEVYDTEGRFEPAKFEAIFSKYALSRQDRLTKQELDHMLLCNRNTFDFFGWSASRVEWHFLYRLAKDDEGNLTKDAVRALYDGTLFEYFEQLHKSKSRSSSKSD